MAQCSHAYRPTSNPGPGLPRGSKPLRDDGWFRMFGSGSLTCQGLWIGGGEATVGACDFPMGRGDGLCPGVTLAGILPRGEGRPCPLLLWPHSGHWDQV